MCGDCDLKVCERWKWAADRGALNPIVGRLKHDDSTSSAASSLSAGASAGAGSSTRHSRVLQADNFAADGSPLLHVVIVISNPVPYHRRYMLAHQFIKRMEASPCREAFRLYVVELAYEGGTFQVAEADNPRHLRLFTRTAQLWHKENMVNIGVRKLLPADWQALAWIDADVEFDSPTWAQDAIKILCDTKVADVVQLFSYAADLDIHGDTMSMFPSFGYQHINGRTHPKKRAPGSKEPPSAGNVNLWHPGFAWAITRVAYDAIGGLFEVGILGSGDQHMAMAFIGLAGKSANASVSPGYHAALATLQESVNAAKIRLAYVPGVIRHHFHGNKLNRKYADRWQLLVDHKYDPRVHVSARASDGLIIPTRACPAALLADIRDYFSARSEDEGLDDVAKIRAQIAYVQSTKGRSVHF